ncbi:MAG: SIMPL domain-containing protein [Candidatus Pacebacteria bacterium]|nr:SIMPL domain-containing protein [Candidatus Paceibacterota bacterium]
MTPSEQDIARTNYWIRIAGATALGLLAVFLFVASIYALKSVRYIGSGVSASNTISVSGDGEVFAVPDTATFSVTVQERAKDVATAQTAATKKNNDIIAYLKAEGVEEKDIQTADYNVNPQYEYTNGSCTSGYCQPGKQTLIGFEVTQTLAVKVKDTDKAGDLLSGVGTKGASSVSGLSFTIDDQDQLEADARDKAIADAQAKADVLAESLGVTIVRIVGFNESGYEPYAYGRGGIMAMDAVNQTKAESAPSPELPVGQNKITSNVNITYEIR